MSNDLTSVGLSEEKLRRAMNGQRMVRVERSPKYADRLDGFVVDVGEKWSLLAQISDGGFFDGFVAFRLRDVERVRKVKSFESAYAMTRPEWPPVAPAPVDLDATAAVILTLAAAGPLIGIQKEHERRGMWIGSIFEVEGRHVYLHEVRPDATWHSASLGYKLKAITTVEVGTHYLIGLAAIAGDAPTQN